ncbi:YbcC family protein [Aquamicrobium soli]|uniref:Probable inorganic carbon transporter subunit DabA n=1 Tax=Aquamicrobium soli TaxID=1811518 RepID=A0ABV7K666_9HYPH
MLNRIDAHRIPASGRTIEAAWRAARQVPPLWPLDSSVTVNPFLGQTGGSLEMAASRLGRVAGMRITMPRSWYAARIRSGEIDDIDLAAALAGASAPGAPKARADLDVGLRAEPPCPTPLPAVAELAAEASGTDWPGFLTERISHWAADYFDMAQALWAAPKGRGAYDSWRDSARFDLSPEIAGLKRFAAFAAHLPETAEQAILDCAGYLGLSDTALEIYFHRLLMSLGGWAQIGRYRLWQAELRDNSDRTLIDLLAIRLVWEKAIFCQYVSSIEDKWRETRKLYAEEIAPSADDILDSVLQEAAEHGAQRRLAAVLAAGQTRPPSGRAKLQMAFCIDVRSEVFRRALESFDPGIRTLGFAGFFGFGVSHRRFASDIEENRLPPQLAPASNTRSCDGSAAMAKLDEAARLGERAARAWGRFRLAAVSSFAFVEAMGPVYVSKLLRNGLGFAKIKLPSDPAPRFDPPLAPASRVAMAEKVLRSMSLTHDFARLVVIAGHGASVVNNPHASMLHCGACGGFSGDVNARLLAGVLNDAAVRAGLAKRGIPVPDDTFFLAALHDTTTDTVMLYEDDQHFATHAEDIEQLKRWFSAAGALTRTERALRLPRRPPATALAHRARDWAEVRPEWGLTGCQAFIAAPRSRTSGRNLQGRVFLHNYVWREDEDFKVLELIMTAPVIVASWISLQYYGSTVAPQVFGAGNKLLHNITGGMGVVEGNGGLLRGGVPWQSVHDGENFVHEPLRMSVVIEAPCEAITKVLARHPDVRQLFDNRWLHLFALDDTGRLAWRYAGRGGWIDAFEHARCEAALELAPR